MTVFKLIFLRLGKEADATLFAGGEAKRVDGSSTPPSERKQSLAVGHQHDQKRRKSYLGRLVTKGWHNFKKGL